MWPAKRNVALHGLKAQKPNRSMLGIAIVAASLHLQPTHRGCPACQVFQTSRSHPQAPTQQALLQQLLLPNRTQHQHQSQHLPPNQHLHRLLNLHLLLNLHRLLSLHRLPNLHRLLSRLPQPNRQLAPSRQLLHQETSEYPSTTQASSRVPSDFLSLHPNGHVRCGRWCQHDS